MVIPPVMVDRRNPHCWWPGCSPGITWYSFTNLRGMEGSVGLAARGDREICCYDLHGEWNSCCSHGSTIIYPLCFSSLVFYEALWFNTLPTGKHFHISLQKEIVERINWTIDILQRPIKDAKTTWLRYS